MSETTSTTGTSSGLRGHRRWYWIGGGAIAILVVAMAMAVPRAWAFRGGAFAAYGGPGGHGFAAGMRHDPAVAKEHAAMALEWLLRGVSASEEQRQQARRIGEGLIDELTPAVQKHRTHQQALARELAKPQIDRDVIERLRKEEITLADEASRKLTAAIADLAEVLTPEQRAEVLDLVQRLHGGESHPLE